jgi:hypothetical protein
MKLPRRVRITSALSSDLAKAEKELGAQTVRRLMTRQGGKLLRADRYANLREGTGKLQPWEKARLVKITKNRTALDALQEKGEDRGTLYSPKKRPLAASTKKREMDSALKDWMLHGKQAGVDYHSQSKAKQRDQIKAVKALKFLGVESLDADDGDVYVKPN